MKLQIKGLKEGINILRMEGTPEEADLRDSGLEFVSPVELSLKVVRHRETFWVGAVIKVSVVLECARCLKRYKEGLEAEFKLVVRRGGGPLPGWDEEDMKLVPPDAEDVDITQEVHDFVLLSVPMKPLCSEGCKGLCPVGSREYASVWKRAAPHAATPALLAPHQPRRLIQPDSSQVSPQ